MSHPLYVAVLFCVYGYILGVWALHHQWFLFGVFILLAALQYKMWRWDSSSNGTR